MAGLDGVIEVTRLRRISRAPEISQLLLTFALVLIGGGAVRYLWGMSHKTVAMPTGLAGAVSVLGHPFPAYTLWIIALGPVVLLGLWFILAHTRWGILVRAATEDRDMVAVLGEDQARLFTGVFVLGSWLVGVGGTLAAPLVALTPGMDTTMIVEAFVVVVIGGMGSVPGSLLSALLIGELQAFGVLRLPRLTLMLRVEDLSVGYGASHVLSGVTLEVAQGEVVCLLGRNGSGKSTLVQSLMGLVRPRQGRIVFRGEDITGLPPHRICRRGLGLVPEHRRLFQSLTVQENHAVGWRPERDGSIRAAYERAFALFPVLRPLAQHKAGTLSGGEQQMLAIARTLMGQPACLLLDEPAEGLAPLVVETLLAQLHALKATDTTIVIAEQHLPLVVSLADRAYMLVHGIIRYAGSMTDILAHPALMQTYRNV
jgi:branched-chain amino acid transport system ATP-binding protein